METTDEILEENNQPTAVPRGLKTLAVLTYIGKGLLLLMFVLTLVAAFTSEELFVDKIPDAEMTTVEFIRMLKILSLAFIITSIGAIIGATMMSGGKRKGFRIYAISNGAYCTVFLFGIDLVGIILVGLGLLFILSYWRHAKNFN